jgi:hypothetical protein
MNFTTRNYSLGFRMAFFQRGGPEDYSGLLPGKESSNEGKTAISGTKPAKPA